MQKRVHTWLLVMSFIESLNCQSIHVNVCLVRLACQSPVNSIILHVESLPVIIYHPLSDIFLS
jgi:hypothetical protein